MSRYVAALVYRKRIGSMARKAVLAYCAERANDDGTGVWASKLTMSKEIECSKQTIIDTIKSFVAEGVMIEAGKRKCSNGYVVEYDLNIAAIDALPDAISREESTGPILDRSNRLTPRGQAAGPQEVKPLDPNRPLTVLKPSLLKTIQKADEDSEPTPETGDGSPSLFSAIEPKVPYDPEPDRFDEFWKAFPNCQRKTDKPKARSAFWSIVQGKRKGIDKTQAETIIAAVRRYASTNPDPQYVPMPTTWLNGARWEQFPEVTEETRRKKFAPPAHEEIVR